MRVHWVEYLLARLLFVQQTNLLHVQRLTEQSLVFFQEKTYARFKVYPLSLLARMRLSQDEVNRAHAWLEESLALVQEAASPTSLCM